METESLELIDLEVFFNDVPCESQHNHSECSIEVTTRTDGCTGPLNVCENAKRRILEHMKNRRMMCRDCDRPAYQCWRVYPI